MRRSGMLLVAALAGCQFIEEVRTDPDQVTWGGGVQVDRSVTTGTIDSLTEGAVTMLDLNGQLLAEAVQPFTDELGYWRFEAAPVDEEVAIRLTSDGMTPWVWRATVPSGAALWFTGALFAREPAVHQAYFEALDGMSGISASSLEDGEVAAIWGEPIDPDEWAGVDIVVTDGDGVQAPVWRLVLGASGRLVEAGDGPVDLFIAPNLQPGTVTLTAGGATTQWPAQGGDMLSAIFYDLEEP
jgi:hypothetical protein